MKNQKRKNKKNYILNYPKRQIVVSLIDCWNGYSTLESYIGRFLQALTFTEIQKNMIIAFKEEPGYKREFERIEKFILLCHLQIIEKENTLQI